jgi:hypothetical protein
MRSLKLHPDDTPAEGVLVAWSVTLEGGKVLLGLQFGSRESYESWLAFGRDLIARVPAWCAPTARPACGRPSVSCGRRSMSSAARCMPLRNVTAKLPDRHHVEVKARWWKTFDEAASPAEARRELEAIIADYRGAYPAAMAVIERDLDALVTHLRWPTEHRKRIRTTNLLERTFVEVRRRTKVIGRFPGETSALYTGRQPHRDLVGRGRSVVVGSCVASSLGRVPRPASSSCRSRVMRNASRFCATAA